MSFLRRIRALFRRNQLDRDMAEEMRFHLDERTEDHVDDGMRADEARAAAHRKFGGVAQIQEEARDVRRWVWLEQTVQDIRYALRQLRQSPGFTAIVVVTLALGIGATTAIFAVMNTHLLDPIPGENESRLIEINEVSIHGERQFGSTAYLFEQVKQRDDTFEEVTVFHGDYMQVADGDFFAHVRGAVVDVDFFDFFEVQPMLGRWLTHGEREEVAEDLIVISHAWWRSRFGGDPNVIGRRIKIRDQFHQDATRTIIGVMPPHFRFPQRGHSYWRPLRFSAWELSAPDSPNYTIFARLAPGVSAEAAQRSLDTTWAQIIRDFPSPVPRPADRLTLARPMRDYFVAPEVRKSLWGVAVAAGLVLLIVCANVGNLQVARGETRLREMSVRAALGASRIRLLRQLLAESIVLSLVGGAGGLVLALWLRHLGDALLPAEAPVLRASGIDMATLMWTLGISTVCGVALGLFPAWRTADNRLRRFLADSMQHGSTRAGRQWSRKVLVVVQVATAMVLLTGAGLLVRSIVQLLHIDIGLDPKGLVEIYPGIPLNHYTTEEQKVAINRAIATRFTALPGTTAVGMTTGGGGTVRYLGDNPTSTEVSLRDVGTGDLDFFRTLGVALTTGRWFTPTDDNPEARTVIVNETLAKKFGSVQNAIGKRIYSLGRERRQQEWVGYFVEIVGVVEDFRTWALEDAPRSSIYSPAGRRHETGHPFYIRTSLDPGSLAAAVRQISKDVVAGPYQPQINWIEEQLYASTATRRLLTWLMVALAGVGLFLAMLGVFGVLLHNVVQRTKEIGIRMALGAQHREIIALVVRQGMALVSLGILVGIGGSLVLSRLSRSLLYDVSPTDPITFVSMPLLLLAAAALASWLPARRAANVNPVVALRAE